MIEGRQWSFSVSAETKENELVCIVGSCEALGSWNPCHIVTMQRQKDAGTVSLNDLNSSNDRSDNSQDVEKAVLWNTTLQLPMEKIDYRYCIAVLASLPNTQPIYAIRKWETHFKPRSIQASITQPTDETISVFGHSCGQLHVEAGWLVHDSAVHLKLCTSKNHASPVILWKKKHKDKKVRVKVTPLELGIGGHHGEDTTEATDSRAKSATKGWPHVEVAVLKEDECTFKSQEQFGLLFDEQYFTVFQCRLLDLPTNAFLFDFYIEESPGEIPLFIGCSYLLPSNLTGNFGVATIPITSPRHLPIGQLTVHYMVVKPMPPGFSDMSASYTRYWKDSWKGLEVGHRGAGNSYHSHPKSCATIRENTVASFKYAAENGADMVEIDVQLSRDFVPVIYHDFHVCIALKRKKDQEHSDLLEIPIKDLTLQQLQALKDMSHLTQGVPEDIFSYCDNEDMLYHKKEKGLSKFCDEDFEDHQPFPTLEKALKNVPYTCGFNIEVKWTMQLKDGTFELLHPFELNHFMDLILKVVLEQGGRRKIVFSCFHPDICSMLRLKQNRYPVLFLTQGCSEQWPPYDDVRCETIRQAVLYATAADILGVNLHTEDLLRDASQMDLALQNSLVVFCWGDHNNDRATIAFLKKLGMHAIIYDKIDVYNSKTEKESIFLCEERESLQEEEGGSASTHEDINETVAAAGVSPAPISISDVLALAQSET